MFENLNPQLPYYLLLFLLTVILRCIRAYRQQPDDANEDAKKNYWSNYCYFGFELVNVSAGVFILLSEKATKYVATFMILYVILVILSFFFEDEKVGRRLKTVGHLFVSGVVIAVTFYAFLAFDGLKETSYQAESAKSNIKWRVALPYVDTSLNRNFGVKDRPLLSSFTITVNATSRLEAIAIAKDIFYGEKGPMPFIAKGEKNRLTMVIIESEVIVEPSSI